MQIPDNQKGETEIGKVLLKSQLHAPGDLRAPCRINEVAQK